MPPNDPLKEMAGRGLGLIRNPLRIKILVWFAITACRIARALE